MGKCHPLRGVAYLVAQLVGSTLGAALLKATTTSGEHEGKVPQVLDRSGALGANGLQNPSVAAGNAFLVEAMGTLLLVIVVLETGVNGKSITTEGESMVTLTLTLTLVSTLTLTLTLTLAIYSYPYP